MEKEFTISYKVYPNERLKLLPFHGKEVYPLYIQLIYNRKPIYFKSYFFDLLSKEKYIIDFVGGKKNPGQNEIIAKEERVLDFVIENAKKNIDNITSEIIQENYYKYSKDLLTIMDNGFKDYLHTFFLDEGQAELATVVEVSGEKILSSNFINGFKSALKPELFKRLLENAPYYGPAYLPLYTFIKQKNQEIFATFSVYQWEIYQDEFQLFLKKEYPDYSFKEIQNYIRKLI